MKIHDSPYPEFHLFPLSMKITPDNGYILCGYTGATHPDKLKDDIFIFKTDYQGNKQLIKKFGGTDHEMGYEIQIAHDNGLIFLGYTYSFGAGNCDFYLIKTDENGEL